MGVRDIIGSADSLVNYPNRHGLTDSSLALMAICGIESHA